MSSTNYTQKHITKFWARVNKNGSVPIHAPELGNCWEWQAGGNGKGYGQIRIRLDRKLTHHVAWELTNGDIPSGLWVLHKCDNPACCNPNHLFLGTHQDNVTDKMQKGRGNYQRGEQSRNHKLTDSQVHEIRQRYIPGKVTMQDLANDYHVTIGHISKLINKRMRG